MLAPVLDGWPRVPAVTGGQITWTLSVPPERELAVGAVLAWDALARNSPGRLRPCANDECRLFLIDHSKAEQRPVVLDGHLRQPAEGPPPLPALTRLAPHCSWSR